MKTITWTYFPPDEKPVDVKIVYVPALDDHDLEHPGFLHFLSNTVFVNKRAFAVFDTGSQNARRKAFANLITLSKGGGVILDGQRIALPQPVDDDEPEHPYAKEWGGSHWGTTDAGQNFHLSCSDEFRNNPEAMSAIKQLVDAATSIPIAELLNQSMPTLPAQELTDEWAPYTGNYYKTVYAIRLADGREYDYA